MKILHINDQARFIGGVERILHDMAVTLSSQGEQGLLFTHGGSDTEFGQPFSWQGMSLREAIETFAPDVAIIHKVDNPQVIEAVCAAVRTLIFVHDHDLTCPRRHKYTFGSDVPCRRKAGASCIANLCFVEAAPQENLIPVVLFDGIRRQSRLLKAARQAAGFIVASENMKSELVMNGIDPASITIVPPIPRSIDSIDAIAPATGRRLLYVGQVIRGKGVDLLLKAFARLPEDTTLTVVGDGNHLEACKSLAVSLGIAERVTFTGWVSHDDLKVYYEKSQILVVPSRWPEPFGMVGIEAMARGRPVVAFDSGGISDWLIEGVTGLLAEAGNIDALAQKMLTLLSDKTLREQMGVNARRRVSETYTHQGFIESLVRTLRSQIDEDSHLSLRCG